MCADRKFACREIKTEIKIPSLDPNPVRQYKYPKEAEKSIAESLTVLKEQGVLIKTRNKTNSPIWPVRKSNGKTW